MCYVYSNNIAQILPDEWTKIGRLPQLLQVHNYGHGLIEGRLLIVNNENPNGIFVNLQPSIVER